MSLNDELFCEERKLEKKAIRDQIQRQQSLPSEHIESKRGLKESICLDASSSRFDGLRERFSKFREASKETEQAQEPTQESSTNKSFTHGLVKILHRWKSEHEPNKTQIQSSFTRKKGVNIDPIMVFGLRRDQSLDSATRRGLFHKKGAWSPKSPKVETHSPLENPCLLSPTVRRCCMECPDDNGVVERRLSRGEAGSDSSKDSSIQSDTSLDSEDSCISVIFVPHPELKSNSESTKQSPQSQRSTSNSSESSESPTGRGSPMSTGSKLLSPSKLHAKGKISKLTTENNLEKSKSEDDKLADIRESEEPPPLHCNKLRHTGLSMLPRIPEHRSFELEDLPIENPINCHPLGGAQRVEIMNEDDVPLSPRPKEDSNSRYNYPIVKHHPLFAKTHKSRSGISSLLLGESIEFRRKPGQSSCQGVQSVRKSIPKLLTFEIYNPETDDLDSDTSMSSSPDSEESVVSVISDSSRAIPKNLDILDDRINITEPIMETKDDDTIFVFDPELVIESSEDVTIDTKDEEQNTLYDKKEMERKSELRKKELINLLGENKNVFQNISSHIKSGEDIEGVVLKTASQLQSMEELRIPMLKRSIECISPDIKECKSEPILYIPKNISQQDSLESISSLSETKQDNVPENPNSIEIKPTDEKAKVSDKQIKISTLVKMKLAGMKIDDDMMPEIVISDASEINVQTCEPEPTNIKECNNPSSLLDQQTEDKQCDTTAIESEKEKVISESPSPKSFDEKLSESGSKCEIEGQPIVPFRRLERKKRDDSLESNTPSVKSSIYHSDTGSVLSHRFSTISISSNLSSDVSFGNNSGVSGSSCYLASMSSADFDDRPPLASSFSLSEAEENEYLSSQPSQEDPSKGDIGQPQATLPPVKKDQLSPPRTEQRTPKLKCLFKRSSDGKSRSTSHDSKKSLQSSCENRSRDGADEAGSKPRSRIGSALTPDTSVEQTTCVERCSSSFEEELMRSFNKDDNDDQGSPSDSEDSAEAGGSLTHHRYFFLV